MKKDMTKAPRTLEHIIPIVNGRYVFLYGLNLKNEMLYCLSDKPDAFFSHPIVQDGQWVIMGDYKIPSAYFSKYLKNQP